MGNQKSLVVMERNERDGPADDHTSFALACYSIAPAAAAAALIAYRSEMEQPSHTKINQKGRT